MSKLHVGAEFSTHVLHQPPLLTLAGVAPESAHDHPRAPTSPIAITTALVDIDDLASVPARPGPPPEVAWA